MITSMTGYGKAECELPGKKITIEIKSLNSKQLDLNTRLPGLYREKDLDIRKEISDRLIRGKIDFIMYAESLGIESNASINGVIVKNYYRQLSEIGSELGIKDVKSSVLQVILGLPDAVKTEREELDEEEWQMILIKIRETMDSVNDFRIREGTSIQADIVTNIDLITSLLEQVVQYEQERIENVKTRILTGLKEISGSNNIDSNRLEQEMIFYLEKLDLNEEKVRLGNHCHYFLETIETPEPSGKKLGFIAQEIGREINTLGSKANHVEIQKLVIRMKDALEKIKEQLLNVL